MATRNTEQGNGQILSLLRGLIRSGGRASGMRGSGVASCLNFPRAHPGFRSGLAPGMQILGEFLHSPCQLYTHAIQPFGSDPILTRIGSHIPKKNIIG